MLGPSDAKIFSGVGAEKLITSEELLVLCQVDTTNALPENDEIVVEFAFPIVWVVTCQIDSEVMYVSKPGLFNDNEK